jgi:hypothetical protein
VCWDYVWWLGNFCVPPCPWIFAFLLVHEFLHSSLSMNFCIPPCPWIFVISLWDALPPCVRYWCWILSYDACELWISVNLNAGSNFCEFSHILAGSRMQPLMAAKSRLDSGCSRQGGNRLLYGWPTYL